MDKFVAKIMREIVWTYSENRERDCPEEFNDEQVKDMLNGINKEIVRVINDEINYNLAKDLKQISQK